MGVVSLTMKYFAPVVVNGELETVTDPPVVSITAPVIGVVDAKGISVTVMSVPSLEIMLSAAFVLKVPAPPPVIWRVLPSVLNISSSMSLFVTIGLVRVMGVVTPVTILFAVVSSKVQVVHEKVPPEFATRVSEAVDPKNWTLVRVAVVPVWSMKFLAELGSWNLTVSISRVLPSVWIMVSLIVELITSLFSKVTGVPSDLIRYLAFVVVKSVLSIVSYPPVVSTTASVTGVVDVNGISVTDTTVPELEMIFLASFVLKVPAPPPVIVSVLPSVIIISSSMSLLVTTGLVIVIGVDTPVIMRLAVV